MISSLWESLTAFHLNGAFHVIYMIKTNVFFFLFFLSVISTCAMLIGEEIEDSYEEEQNII